MYNNNNVEGIKTYLLVKSFFRCSSYCGSHGKAYIVFNTFNFVLKEVIEWLIINDVSIIKMRLNKRFVESHYFQNSPLFTLLNIVCRCFSKLSWLSKIKRRCFWKAVCLTFVLLKLSEVCSGFLILREKISYCACLAGSKLKLINHGVAQLLIFKSSLRFFLEVIKLWTTEKWDLPSANNLGFDDTFSEKLLM